MLKLLPWGRSLIAIALAITIKQFAMRQDGKQRSD
jgi:hypothetical protein